MLQQYTDTDGCLIPLKLTAGCAAGDLKQNPSIALTLGQCRLVPLLNFEVSASSTNPMV